MKIALRFLAAMFLLASAISTTSADTNRLWVYAPVNFQVNEDVDRLLALLERAKKAGYNGAVITDYKFGKIDDRPQRYYDNLKRTRVAGERLGVQLIPCVMPIGYSNSILQNNPNLAASLPVRDCEFTVKDGRAVAVSEDLLTGGAFENADRRRPAGWDWVDGYGTSTELDRSEKHGGTSSLRLTDFRQGNEHGNCRVVKKLRLRPWHQYRVTLWIKSQNLAGAGELKVMPLGKSGPLNYARLGVKATQDWRQHRITFNTLEHEEVNLYIGLWGGTEGTFWLDDVQLEVVGGVNLLRREGCPLRVTSHDGKTQYEEGRDFKPWKDPHLGRRPYAGEFSQDQDPPPLVLTENSRIRPDEKLLVSFYHTAIIYDGQVCCSLMHDELFKHLQRQVELLEKYLRPTAYFMQHDEIRLAGYDAPAMQNGTPAGELLAGNVRRCTQIIRELNPKATVLVWSDMFDPHHNAVDNYYLVRGSLAGSWKGLDQSVEVVNWNRPKADKSLAWFAGRGHRQLVAGYYDGDVKKNLQQWRAAAAGVKGISGYLYTTWRGNYDRLENFAQLVKAK